MTPTTREALSMEPTEARSTEHKQMGTRTQWWVSAEASGAGEAACKATLVSTAEIKGTDRVTALSAELASLAIAAEKRVTSHGTALKLLCATTAANLATIHRNALSTGEASCAIIVVVRVT